MAKQTKAEKAARKKLKRNVRKVKKAGLGALIWNPRSK